jgi:hypothetical protein
MLLDTIRCSTPGCFNEFTEDLPSWHLILFAKDAGWTFSDDEEKTWCPEHAEDHDPFGLEAVWVVGCRTCDFEEEYDSEEEAKNEYTGHECESDTWIWKPDEVRVHQERRAHALQVHAERRAAEEKVAKASFDRAMAEQDRIYRYANQWLRIRNLFLFWKREHIQ